jgi:hypothetical protein
VPTAKGATVAREDTSGAASGVTFFVGVGVGEGVGVGVVLGVGVTVAEGVGVGVSLGVAVGVGVGVTSAVALGVGVGVGKGAASAGDAPNHVVTNTAQVTTTATARDVRCLLLTLRSRTIHPP